MKKYKYTRKERINKYIKDNNYSVSPEESELFKDLLVTVDKPEKECPKCFGEGDIMKNIGNGVVFNTCPKCNGARYLKSKKKDKEEEIKVTLFHIEKQNKIIDRVFTLNTNKFKNFELNIGYNLSKRIKSTPKQELEVPDKISLIRWRIMTPEARQRHLWGKQCELIDYLTLISLDKK